MEFNISKGMIDSHFHTMEMARKGLDVPSILTRLHTEGIEILVDAGVHVQDFEERLRYRRFHPGMVLAAGIHPNIPASEWPESFEEILSEQAAHPMVKALGETGLDFYRDFSTEKDQYTLLEVHHKLALEVKKPLIFHCRAAEKELALWIKARDFPCGGVLHCFSGDEALAKTALEKGFMISLAGNATFKNAREIRQSLDWIPLSQLLVETDAPYLSPHPLRGKPNHPGHIGYIYDMIASEKRLALEELIPMIHQNLKDFLRL